MSDNKKYEIEFDCDGKIIYRDYTIPDNYEFLHLTSGEITMHSYKNLKECMEFIDNHLDNKTIEITIMDDCIVYKGYKIQKETNSKWIDVVNPETLEPLSAFLSITSCFKYIDDITGDS